MALLPFKRISQFGGIDIGSTPEERSENSATGGLNWQLKTSGALEKRHGYKSRLLSQGGYGLFTYLEKDQDTGAQTERLINIGQAPYEASFTTFQVSYSGTSRALFSIKVADDGSEFECVLNEDGTDILTYGLGNGWDEASTITLANIKTQIDGESGWSATITGTTSLPAALLPIVKEKLIEPSGSVSYLVGEWASINTSVSTPFSGSETNKNSSSFENISGTNLNSVLYVTNGYAYPQKFDGQTLYRVGLPKLSRPTLTNTASGGGVAEITDVICRGAAAVAQIQDVTTIADTLTYNEIELDFDISSSSSDASDWNEAYFQLPDDSAGTVGVWFNDGTGSEPAHGFDRAIEVNVPTLVGNNSKRDIQLAGVIQAAIDADAKYTAYIIRDDLISVTSVDGGTRANPATIFTEGDGSSILANTTIPQGAGTQSTFYDAAMKIKPLVVGGSALNQSYFKLKDEDGSVAVWLDLSGSGTEPDHGCDRAIEVTGGSEGDTANSLASAISTAVNADSKFSTSVATDTITITNATGAEVGSDVDAGTSGFSISITTAGLDSLHEKYFIVYEDVGEDDGVAFWFDIGGGGAEPSHGAGRAVEITTLGGSDSATTVAGKVETAVHADSGFTASSASATVTITSATTGNNPSPSAGTTDFTVSVTTEGSDAGLGLGAFKYRLTVQQKDAAGNIYNGPPTDFNPSTGEDNSITISTATDNVSLTIQGVQASSGFNTGCATVNGNQTSTNTVTVNSGHTLKVGDVAYFRDRTLGVDTFVERNITATASTTITIDGDAVDVDSGDAISNNLRIQIWRTKNGGTNPFLVATIPNNSVDGSQTYVDFLGDNYVGEEWAEPIDPHLAPPKAKYSSKWKNKLILAGIPTEPNTIYFSSTQEDGMTSEYFPGGNTITIGSGFGDKVSGVAGDDEYLLAFTRNSTHIVTGDIDTGNIRTDTIDGTEVGCVSHHSITKVNNTWMWLAEDGVYALGPDGKPVEASESIRPFFVNTQNLSSGASFKFERSIGFNDRSNHRFLLYIPAELTDASGNVYATEDSVVWTFDYRKGRGNWYKWGNFNMLGGITEYGDTLYFTERRLSTYTGNVDHITYGIIETGSNYDFNDQLLPVSFSYKSNWHNLGDMSLHKKFVRLLIHSLENMENSTFSLTTRTEKNLVANTYYSNFTQTLATPENETRYQRPQRLKSTKALSKRLTFLNNEINENVCITGYNIYYAAPYQEGGKV